ncbi:hypothetical protein [Nocardia transvalensis]|uniref:hypothetical protein n=1 Tax=Nocardia transvalensis TaxID=37333 RepID=UPI001E4B68F5|nr:hypothetical protein [Nocardia transvalensis]
MSAPVYVNLTDKGFLRLHRGNGTPVIGQILAVLDHRLTDEQLISMYRLRTAGSSMRRVYRPIVPFARWRWVPTDTALPLTVERAAIDEVDVLAWANEQAQFPLDPAGGYGWRLSAVPLRSGGMAVSIIADHAIADGHAGLMGLTGMVDPEFATKDGLGKVVDLRGDLADGMRRSVLVARQAASELRRAARDPQHRAAIGRALLTREPVVEPEPMGWRETSVVVSIDAQHWKQVAARHGGTSNTLYLALAADTLRRCSLIGPDTPLVLATAVRLLREHNQHDSNSFSRVPVPVQREWLDRRELDPIRRMSKAAFANANEVGSGAVSRPRNMPPDLIDVLPAGVVDRLVEPPPITIGMCSNMGVLDPFVPKDMRANGGPSLFVARGAFQKLDTRRAARQPIALASWYSEYGGRVQWVLEGLKPEMAQSDSELAALARDIAESWGLQPLRIHTGGANAAVASKEML